MRKTIGILVIVLGVILALYVGGWALFYDGIFDIVKAIDSNTVTAMVVGIGVIKVSVGSIVGWLIFYFWWVVGFLIWGFDDRYNSVKRRKRRRM